MEIVPPRFALSSGFDDKEVTMTTTVAELLAQKQQLLIRLQEEQPDLNEQDEIVRLLANINAMLNRLDEAPIKTSATRH